MSSSTTEQNEILDKSNPIPELLSNPTKTIIFALPGREFSRHFLLSWSSLLFELIKRNIKPIISQNYSSMVHFSRMRCLGGDVLKGPNQVPYQGQIEYDYICMIDSDIVFNPDDFFKLLDSPYDVTAVPYLMEDTKHYTIVKDMNEDYFLKHGTFPFLTPDEVEKIPKVNGKYFEAAYTGLGFTLIKKGVIDKIQYPWFSSPMMKIGELQDMCSEDVSFCKNLQASGTKIMIDGSLRVGHYKSFVI